MARGHTSGTKWKRAGPCCRYTPPVTQTGNPRIAIAETSIKLYDVNGNFLQEIGQKVRAMFYQPFSERLYIGTKPVTSMNLDGTNVKIHGASFTGILMAFEMNMYDNALYLSISSYLINRLTPDDVFTTLATDPDVDKPRQLRLDTVEGVLYWADETLKTVKSLKVNESSTVTTVFTSTQIVWGMDIDFSERKIYWCAKTTGQVWVYDMAASTNAKLVDNGSTVTGSCSGLRLYNGYLFLIYYRYSFMEKRFKNGTLAEKILDGKMTAPQTKYFAIVE